MLASKDLPIEPSDRTAPRLFISVAEQSADEHAAGLIGSFLQLRSNAQFIGLAGPRLRAAGCVGLADLTSRASMLLGVAARVPAALAVVARVDRLLARNRFDAAVLVDSGTLHLPLARRCRAHGIPVLYFIAPQTWASREWRLRAIRDRVDRLAVILPFEESYFQRNGIPARYVGHPLFDRLIAHPPDSQRVAALRAGAEPIMALLPGSRTQVVREVLPGQLTVVQAVAARYRRARFFLAPANDRLVPLIEAMLGARGLAGTVRIVSSPRADMLAAADLVLVASGTATLETAYYHAPMIVMYNARAARWLYPFLRGTVIRTRFLSLPNILAGRKIVPEFMPYYRNPTEIAATALELLAAPGRIEHIRAELAELMRPIVRPGACANAARELADLLATTARPAQAGPGGSCHRIW